MRRKLLKTGLGVLAALAVLAGVGWLAFVPSAKEPSYEFVKAWGEKGSEPGQFHDPTGIAVANGDLFVADFYGQPVRFTWRTDMPTASRSSARTATSLVSGEALSR